jgi:hypothetical protein
MVHMIAIVLTHKFILVSQNHLLSVYLSICQLKIYGKIMHYKFILALLGLLLMHVIWFVIAY